MADHPNLPRVYGDKEIGQILKKATELQAREPSAPSSSGLTLQELEEVAVEAGIDPRASSLSFRWDRVSTDSRVCSAARSLGVPKHRARPARSRSR